VDKVVPLDLDLDPGLDLLQAVDTATHHTLLYALDRNIYTPTSLRIPQGRHMYPLQLHDHPIHTLSNTCINRRREVILLCVIERIHMMV
jgi:hypothetical protein